MYGWMDGVCMKYVCVVLNGRGWDGMGWYFNVIRSFVHSFIHSCRMDKSPMYVCRFQRGVEH